MTEERSSQIQSALTEFKTWQDLSPKDALQELGTLKTTLETAASMAIDTKTLDNVHTTVSFIKPMSEVFASLENYRSHLEVTIPPQVCVESQSVSSGSQGKDIGTPPTKRKKLSQ